MADFIKWFVSASATLHPADYNNEEYYRVVSIIHLPMVMVARDDC
ncbi:MAG: hypothetical protein AAF810_21480 [Cyanobacteria bacterium P01_D01_bin.36]